MQTFNWQLVLALLCVVAAAWTVLSRLRALLNGQGGCGDCARSRPSASNAESPPVVSENEIEILYTVADEKRSR